MRGRKDRGAGRPRSAGRLAAFVLLAAAAGTLGAQIPDPWRGPDARDLVEAVEAAMVNVEPGVFVMGSDRGLPDSRPTHSVAVTKPFRILRHEVTFEEYDAYCALAGARSPKDNGWGRGRQPVIDVSFADAVRFCNFLSRAAGRTPCYDEEGRTFDPSADGYRLPTEAEWEYAARGGPRSRGFRLSGSDDPSEVAVFGDAPSPAAVESKKPNELGIYDMSGNVWEWCQDWYAAAWYSKAPPGSLDGTAPWADPAGPDISEADRSYGVKRVRRGGNYHESADSAAVHFRSRDLPKQADPGMGFRIVRNGP